MATVCVHGAEWKVTADDGLANDWFGMSTATPWLCVSREYTTECDECPTGTESNTDGSACEERAGPSSVVMMSGARRP